MSLLFILKILFLSLNPNIWAQKAHNFQIQVGESIKLFSPAQEKLKIIGKKYISIKEFPQHLKITGVQEGTAIILQKNKQSVISILSFNKKLAIETLKNSLKEKLGLYLHVNSNQVYIKGNLHRLDDWEDIKNLAQTELLSFHFQAQLDKDLYKEAFEFFKNKLKLQNLLLPKILWSPYPKVFLNPQDSQRYKNFFKSYGFQIQESPLEQIDKQFVELKVLFFELQKSESEAFLVNLQQRFSFSSLLQHIKMKTQTGKGESFQEWTTVCPHKKNITIKNGGQIPYTSYDIKSETQSTQWKTYGLNLNIYCEILASSQIFLKWKLQFSDINLIYAMENTPSLKTYSNQSEIIINNKSSQILSEILRNKQGGSQTRFAFLKYIPFLKKLSPKSGKVTSNSKTFILIQAEIK